MIAVERKILHYFIYIFIFKILYDYISLEYILDIMYLDRSVVFKLVWYKYLCSLSLFIISTLYTICATISNKTSCIILNCLLLFYYIPSNFIYCVSDADFGFLFWGNLYWFFIIFFYKKIDFRISKNSFSFLNKLNLNIIFPVLFIGTLVYVYSFNGLSISFDLSEVYDRRMDGHNISLIFGWLKGGIGFVVGPLFIVYFYRQKKFLYLFLAILMQILYFSISMDKIIIFFLFPTIGLMFFSKIRFTNIFIYSSLILMNFITLAELLWLKSGYIMYFLIRRTYFIPSWMNTLYYDFFEKHDKLMFGSDVFVLSKFIPSVYDRGVLDLISKQYFSGDMPSPNTGMFAEAYMHFGILGVIIIPIFFVIILKIIDSVTCHFPTNMCLIYAFSLSLILINVPITGGYFASLFICSFPFIVKMNDVYANKY